MLPSLTLTIKPCGDACNLQCRYCFNEFGVARHEIDFSELQKILDSLKGKKLRILLSGGEPLLYGTSQMERLLAFLVTALGPDVPVQVQTNGTLLTREWVDLFSRYNVSDNIIFSISLDPLIGNLRLKSSDLWSQLYANIKMCLQEFPLLGIVSIVHRDNMDSFQDFSEKLSDDGIRYLTVNNMRGVEYDDRNVKEAVLSEAQYLNFLQEYLLWWVDTKLYRKLQVQPLMSFFSKDANRLCLYSNVVEKCSSNPVFSPDGYAPHCELLKDPSYKSTKECQLCRIYEFCGGGCPAVLRDNSFCEARLKFHDFLKGIKDGSN